MVEEEGVVGVGSQIIGAHIVDLPSPNNAQLIPREKVHDLLDSWWAAHFPGSPVARNTAAWNHANAAFGNLKALINAL
jgi:hypothetical protein